MMNYLVTNWLIGLLILLFIAIGLILPLVRSRIEKISIWRAERQRSSHKPEQSQPHPRQQSEPQLMVMHVEAQQATDEFNGADVLDLLEQSGLMSGDMDMYQRYIEYQGENKLVFNVINGVDPGTLSQEFRHSSTPCLTLFFAVEQSYNPVKSLKQMIDLAEELARQLGGQVQDTNHSALTMQTRQHMLAMLERRSLTHPDLA